MIFVPQDASNEQVLTIVRDWLDLLAREDYQAAFAAIGAWHIRGEWTPEYLRDDIKGYRSPEYYPGVEDFTVTEWRMAQGGNPDAKQEVRWFLEPPDNFPLVGTVSFDLPLNGRWSDLCADFVLFKSESEGRLFAGVGGDHLLATVAA